ncbi:hypothetical protein RND81_13G100500 [Saponaria officinalis]|uniref:Myb-like domain-containing protein n=1 Tax=Saponaria officinalis TaxID=3572 RepID=A0AAW1GY32_SAPOF
MKEEQCGVLNQGITEEKNRRHPRWTREETLTLIQAKDIAENLPNKGRKISSFENNDSNGNGNSEPKWVMISEYCKSQGVGREPAQCRKRWSNLIGDYKRIKCWEDNLNNNNNNKGEESYWVMRNDLRKERKLPVSFDWEVFKVLVGREMGGVMSPVPLQAVVVAVVEEGEGEGEGEKIVNDGECLGVEDVGDEKEEVLELGLKSIDQMFEKSFVKERDEPNSDGLRESWPGIYWDSQEKAKRRRLSTDDSKSNDIEAEMMRVLEENNKMVNAQLEIHNKNVKLDREQRKETNDVLVAALGKLTNVLVKIAEKL